MGDKIETSNSELLDIALLLLKVPERIERVSTVQLKELLIYLKNRKEKIGRDICKQIEIIDEREHLDSSYHYDYPEKYLPGELFKYWAQRILRGPLGGYYTTEKLEALVNDRINKTKEETIPSLKIEENNKHSEVFNKGGYEFFLILAKTCNLPKNKKYSQIFYYLSLETYYLKSTKKIIFINFLNIDYLPYLQSNLKDQTISKLYDRVGSGEIYFGPREYKTTWQPSFEKLNKKYNGS